VRLELVPCSYKDYAQFQPFHYWPDRPCHRATRCHLVVVDGVTRGFVASMRDQKHGVGLPEWRAHLTAVLLPISHPQYLRLWALCADVQAQYELSLGHRFWSCAPADHAAYRDGLGSGWVGSSNDGNKSGFRNHQYVGQGLPHTNSRTVRLNW
jgi:hypothetical protein